MSDATDRPPIAECTVCGRFCEVRWFSADTGEPAVPWCCNRPMRLSLRSFRKVWHDEMHANGSFRSWATWVPTDG